MKKKRSEPELILRTGKSEMRIYAHYEKDTKKARQAKNDFDRGVRYVAHKNAWLGILNKRDAAIFKLSRLFQAKALSPMKDMVYDGLHVKEADLKQG